MRGAEKARPCTGLHILGWTSDGTAADDFEGTMLDIVDTLSIADTLGLLPLVDKQLRPAISDQAKLDLDRGETRWFITRELDRRANFKPDSRDTRARDDRSDSTLKEQGIPF